MAEGVETARCLTPHPTSPAPGRWGGPGVMSAAGEPPRSIHFRRRTRSGSPLARLRRFARPRSSHPLRDNRRFNVGWSSTFRQGGYLGPPLRRNWYVQPRSPARCRCRAAAPIRMSSAHRQFERPRGLLMGAAGAAPRRSSSGEDGGERRCPPRTGGEESVFPPKKGAPPFPPTLSAEMVGAGAGAGAGGGGDLAGVCSVGYDPGFGQSPRNGR